MASQTTVTLSDDIDGKKADETVLFSLDGVSYEIDLRRVNANSLRTALQPFLESARKIPAQRYGATTARRRSTTAAAGRRPDLAQIREWARANGMEVSDRGRVATHIVEAYDHR